MSERLRGIKNLVHDSKVIELRIQIQSQLKGKEVHFYIFQSNSYIAYSTNPKKEFWGIGLSKS